MRTSTYLGANFFTKLSMIVFPKTSTKRLQKTHDYRQFVWGNDYVFEPVNEGMEAQMTGIGKGIKPYDYILLQRNYVNYRYQVEEINYYSDPPDMWIASLKKVVD